MMACCIFTYHAGQPVRLGNLRKMSSRILLLAFLVGGWLAAAPATKVVTAAGVSLRYPAAWTLIDDQATLRRLLGLGETALDARLPRDNWGIQFMLLEKSLGTPGNPSLNVVLEKLPAAMDSQRYGEVAKSNLPRMLPSAHVTAGPRARKLGRHTFYQLQYDLQVAGQSRHVSAYFIANPKLLTVYIFTAFPGPAGVAPFETVIATVTLPDGFTGPP